MPYFVFQCRLHPSEKSPHKDEFEYGISHTWVQSESMDEAREKIFDHFCDTDWDLDSIEVEKESDIQNHPWNHKEEQPDSNFPLSLHAAWLKLHKYGIGSEICVKPKN